MTNAITPAPPTAPDIMEKLLVGGDLTKLSSQQRLDYYSAVCRSLGLNPLTEPFKYISLNGKLTLYATRNCSDQLRGRDKISIRIVSRELIDGLYVVVASASTPDGRIDESTGAVPVDKLSGENRANAFMKAETKAKRRATLSICGLGFADESEIDGIPSAKTVEMPKHLDAPKQADTKDTAEHASAVSMATSGISSRGQSATQKQVQEAIQEAAPEAVQELWEEMQKGKFEALGVLSRLKGVIIKAFGEKEGDLKYRHILAKYVPQSHWDKEEKRPKATAFTDSDWGIGGTEKQRKLHRFMAMRDAARDLYELVNDEAQRRAQQPEGATV